LVPIEHNVARVEAEAYLRTRWHPDASGRVATIDMGRAYAGLPSSVNRESGDCCAPFRGGAWSPSDTMWEACLRTDSHTDGQTDRQTDGIAIASTALAMRALRRAVKINRKQTSSNRAL